jgi:retron-type reverse transcriptase
VERNAGAAGVDGMEVSQLRRYLLENWDRIKEKILNGSYEPRPVRRVDIPKPEEDHVRFPGSRPTSRKSSLTSCL